MGQDDQFGQCGQLKIFFLQSWPILPQSVFNKKIQVTNS